MIRSKMWLVLILCMALAPWPAHAEVDSKVMNTLKLTHPPIDMDISLSGQRIYVLDDHGQVLIYDISGRLTDTIEVGPGVDQIKVSPRDDLLFLSNRKEKSVKLVSLTFTQIIDISGAPYQGPANAPVAIVVFSDFQCPYCARIGAIIDEVRNQYPQEVKSVFKNFPLASHKYSTEAAKAAVAAGAQGKFWEFHDLLFLNYSQLNEQKIEEFRTALNLKKDQFEKDKEAPQTLARIQKDKQDGEEAGVRGTPTVFVNGRMVRPANTDGIKSAVQDALKALRKQ